jgi:hypothetical protein
MTALNQNYTTEYNLQTGPRRVPSGQFDAPHRVAWLREAYITGQGTVNAFVLPAGNIRIYRDPSRLSTENAVWTNAGVTLVVGHAAYTDYAGVVQSAVTNAFITSQTPQAAALDLALTLGTGILYKDYNTQNGLTITYTIGTADKAAADIFNLVIVYSEIGIGT